MQGTIDKCTGCEEDPQTVDHIHYFTNFFNNRTKVWVIEGTTFISLTIAVRFIRDQLDCSMPEASEYIRTLPMFYAS